MPQAKEKAHGLGIYILKNSMMQQKAKFYAKDGPGSSPQTTKRKEAHSHTHTHTPLSEDSYGNPFGEDSKGQGP